MTTRAPLTLDGGSFRDPAGGVVLDGGRVFRCLRGEAGREVAALLGAPWFAKLISAGDVVETAALAPDDAPELYEAMPGVTAAFEHARIPFVSYPYEWPFEMLRTAALHQLQLTTRAFTNGHMVKDATPYNVQFRGARPVFIDVASFEPYRAGEGWRAYAQFCRLFLNPLYLEAYGGVPYQPWLRGSLDGIDTDLVRRIVPFRAKLRPSVFIDVVLQSILTHRFASNDDALRSAGHRQIPDSAVRGMLDRATGTVAKLRRRRRDSTWSGYESGSTHYSAEAMAFRERFVAETLERERPRIVWDIGCNTGRFSMIAARTAEHVVAIDGDEPSVNLLYERARASAPNVLPLVMDLGNPSPNQGWAQEERQGLIERGPADLVLALALVHHLAVAGNVPLPRFSGWLASIGRSAIVEFVPKSDPMVQRLLLTRRDVYDDYTPAAFEDALAARWQVVERAAVPDCDRVLYACRRIDPR